MRKIVLLLLIFFTLLASGCWDRKEVDELAIVGAVGFDKVTVNGQNMYQIIVNIYKPGEMGGGNEGGQGKATAQCHQANLQKFYKI